MGAFQIVDSIDAMKIDKIDTIANQIAAKVIITRCALLVAITIIESELRTTSSSEIMSGMILSRMMAAATNTRIIMIT